MRQGSTGTRSAAHAVAPADAHDRGGDDRMQMEMPVRIDVVERQSGGAKRRELRVDLLRRLPPRRRAQRERGAVAGKVVAQIAVAVD